MEKRKWLWKRRSSEKSPGETESSGSVSSHSERFSDDQEISKASPNYDAQSPDNTSKAAASGEEVHDGVKFHTEKLSAVLSNVSAKDDLVQQHAKVAEEAIAGWEKAENEVELLKQRLDAATQQNMALEDRVSHLDGALKECVRQLRQAREEQEHKMHEAFVNQNQEWESTKSQLENQLLELQTQVEAAKTGQQRVDPDVYHKLEALEKENSSLKHDLICQLKELEIRTIERDLSTEAAETASKQHLESIKRVARIEAECRMLKAMAHKPSSINEPKSSPSLSLNVGSDCLSDKGEQTNVIDFAVHKLSSLEVDEQKSSCSNSWASALIAELDQFKNEKGTGRGLTSSSVKMDIMDDFLEMEQLASLPQDLSRSHHLETETVAGVCSNVDSQLNAELEASNHRISEMKEMLSKLEVEKAELKDNLAIIDAERAGQELALYKSRTSAEASEIQLKNANMKLEELRRELGLANELKQTLETELAGMKAEAKAMSLKIESLEAEVESRTSAEASEIQLKNAEMKLEELHKELGLANELKQTLETELAGMKAEAKAMSLKVESLEAEVEKQQAQAMEAEVKCQELENRVLRKNQEAELQQIAIVEPKVKQEDLAAAAGKLAECQKTIASLGKQLKSLATLEDFLVDTSNLPGLSGGVSSFPKASHQMWKLQSRDADSLKVKDEAINSFNSNSMFAASSSSSSSSVATFDHAGSERSCNGFGTLFLQNRNEIEDSRGNA